MKRTIFLITMIASIVFAGCKSNKSNQIELGAIIPLTGYSASNGILFQRGLELAVEELNLDSTDISFNVNLEDSKSSPKDALMAYRKLESKGVKYFLGFGGQFVLGFVAETNNSDKALFISAAPNKNMLSLSNRILRIFPNIEMVTDKVRDFVISNNYMNVAIIYAQNEAYAMYYESALKKLQEAGRNVVFIESYDPNCRDFKNIINKLSKQKVDVIYSAGVGESSALLTKQLYGNSTTTNIPIIGDMNFSSPDNLAVIGDIKSPVYSIDSYLDTSFINKYKEKYNQTPNTYAVYGYIIPYLIREALSHLGKEASADNVYEYIMKNAFSTAAGNISFNPDTKEPVLDLVFNSATNNNQ